MMSDPFSPPKAVNPLPAAVVALAAVIFGVEVMFNLAERGLLGGAGGIGWRNQAIQTWGFYGQGLDWMLVNGQYPMDILVRFLSYPLLHFNFTHALFVCVFVLAMGKMVGEVFGNVAVIAIFWGASIVGALAYGLILNDSYPLVGGYPGVYGLIGGYTFLLWMRQKLLGAQQLMAFRLIGFLLGIQLIFGLLFGAGNDWVADLAGFVAGFGMAVFLVPGAVQRLRQKLRGR